MISTWAGTGGPSKSKRIEECLNLRSGRYILVTSVTEDIVNNLDQQFQDLPARSLCGLRFTYERPKNSLRFLSLSQVSLYGFLFYKVPETLVC